MAKASILTFGVGVYVTLNAIGCATERAVSHIYLAGDGETREAIADALSHVWGRHGRDSFDLNGVAYQFSCLGFWRDRSPNPRVFSVADERTLEAADDAVEIYVIQVELDPELQWGVGKQYLFAVYEDDPTASDPASRRVYSAGILRTTIPVLADKSWGNLFWPAILGADSVVWVRRYSDAF